MEIELLRKILKVVENLWFTGIVLYFSFWTYKKWKNK